MNWVEVLCLHSTFKKGSIAQLVQSICLTSRGSAVRTRVLPHYKGHSHHADGLFLSLPILLR